MSALQGMKNVIAENDGLAIITEFNPWALHPSGFEPIECLDKLIEYGFGLFPILGQKIERADPTKIIEMKHGMNVLCVQRRWQRKRLEVRHPPQDYCR